MRFRSFAGASACVVALSACGDDPAAEAGPQGPGAGAAAPGATGGEGSGAAGPALDGGAPGTGGSAAAGGAAAGGAAGGGAPDNGSGPEPSGCRAPVPNPSPGNACQGGPPAPLTLTEVASGLARPLYVTHAPGDPSRLFVVEQAGVIRLIKDGVLLPQPFLDIRSQVVMDALLSFYEEREQGLLGLAFDPAYEQTGRFWTYHTGPGRAARVVAFRVDGNDPDRADPASASTVLTIPQQDAWHQAGMMAFGPDGCLYVSVGDDGLGLSSGLQGGPDAYDARGHAQNLDTLNGSILRLDVDRYPSPAPGNIPGGTGHIWDHGLRNPWRFSFDRETGDLYISDVGQFTREEVNVEAAGTGHKNYGWPIQEGSHCTLATRCDQADMARLTPPTHEYDNSSASNLAGAGAPGQRAVIGGYVYRGGNVPSLRGRYVFADMEQKFWSFIWDGQGVCDHVELTDQLRPGGKVTSFGEDLGGELYVTTLNGRVFRIDPA